MLCFIVLLFADGRGFVLPLRRAPPSLMCEKYFHVRPVGIRQNKYGSDLHDAMKITCKVRGWIVTTSQPTPVAFIHQTIENIRVHLRSSWTASQLENLNVNVNVLHVWPMFPKLLTIIFKYI